MASVRPYKPYQRLNTSGSCVLQEFFDNVSQNPTIAQKKELLLAVNAIAGNDEFTLHRLKAWFQRKRQCIKTRTRICIVKRYKPVLSSSDNPETIMKTCAKLLRLPLPQLEVMLNQPKQLIVSTAPEIETPQRPIPFEIEPELPNVQDSNLLIDRMEATNTPDLPASLSRAEFNALFAPYELKMRAILEQSIF